MTAETMRYFGITSILGAIFIANAVHCSTPAALTAADVTLTLASDVCSEEATQPTEPDWVKVVCQVEGGVDHLPLAAAHEDVDHAG